MSLTTINNDNVFQKDVIGNVRSAQEDSHDIAANTPNGDVFVVCDGMGGHVGGKQASTIAVKSIIEYLKREHYSQPLQALDEALQYANMQILGYASEHPELRGMGTTACIVLLQDSEAYIAHVGDSRIYLYLGKEKQLHRVTKDHSFVQALVDAGQISDEEAENHPNKNRILKALGVKATLEPSFDTIQPKSGDVFLICSDGLSGMVPDRTIAEVLAGNISIAQKGDTLIRLALEAGGLDNITLELIHISNSDCVQSVYHSYNPTPAYRNTAPRPSISPTGRKKNTNRQTFKILILLIVAVLICLGGFIGARHFVNKKKQIARIEQLEQDIKTKEEQLGSLQRDLDAKNVRHKDLEKCKRDAEDVQVKESEQDFDRLLKENQSDIDSLKIQIVRTGEEIGALESEKDSICNRYAINENGNKK